MPWFRHHHDEPGLGPHAPAPGATSAVAGFAAAQGWPPAGDRPFDGHLEDAVAEINRTMHGAARALGEMRLHVMGHDDWVFRAERYLLGCVSQGPFRSAGEVTERISEVIGIVAAIPASVLPGHVDHSGDDLIARVNQLTSMDEGLALLQQLTPEERDRLARSDSPLAALADVRTPQEVMARFKTLDPQAKMQVMTMFMKVRDAQRGH